MRIHAFLRTAGVVAMVALALASCRIDSTATPVSEHSEARWVTGVASDFITAGGWFEIQFAYGTLSGGRANFGWHGGVKNGEWWGNGNYIDHGIGLHVQSTSVTGYERLGQDGSDDQGRLTGTRQVCGWADTNLYGTVRYLVMMADNGEPGRRDRFSIALVNPVTGDFVYAAEGRLGDPTPGGGNVQLHRGNPSNTAPTTPPDCIGNPFSE